MASPHIASRDKNYVPTRLGVSNIDGVTPMTLYANPVTHRLLIRTASTTPTGRDNASRDENREPTVLAASEADGRTPVTIYVGTVTHSMYAEEA